MADVIRMPRLSDTMQEGVIKSWIKKVGDAVKPGDVLAEVETDKATMDLEAFQEGILLHVAVPSGAVPVEGIIAIIGKKGEDISALLQDTAPKAAIAPNRLDLMTRLTISTLFQVLIKEKGVDISKISGSGENGRIIKRDIEELKSASTSSQNSTINYGSLGDQEVILSQMRKTIAKRLSESKFSAPHFYLTCEIDMDACVQAREQLNKLAESKISYNDIIVKAAAMALRKNLAANVSWMGDKMIYHNDIHIGVAVAIDEGLVVPVIRNTDLKSLQQIKSEIADKATRAKDRKLGLDEMQGNTFTISNLGMFDIEDFTAIINPPDACILAVGSIAKKPAVKNDQIVISNRMKVTLSCDHRAVDGAIGAKFLQSFKQFLEQPVSMLL